MSPVCFEISTIRVQLLEAAAGEARTRAISLERFQKFENKEIGRFSMNACALLPD
jgi:hypothetical protein